jgi:hypothetical protein
LSIYIQTYTYVIRFVYVYEEREGEINTRGEGEREREGGGDKYEREKGREEGEDATFVWSVKARDRGKEGYECTSCRDVERSAGHGPMQNRWVGE